MLSSSQIARNHNAFSSGLGVNPAAYQNTLFGGVTPFGQNFGDSIGHSAAGMGSSLFDGAIMAGGGAAIGNMALGGLGLGQSATLASLSKYLGGGLSLGMHMGPMMAISAALGQMSQGSEQRQRVQNAMNENFGSRINVGGRMGTGTNREQVKSFTNELRQLSDIPELFTSMGELTSILDKVTDMKILQGARDAKAFRDKFKKMIGSLRDMSRDLGSTMEEALPFLQSSVSQGFLDPKMQALNVRLLNASAGTGIGVGRGTMNQMQEQGAMAVRQMGGDSRLGAAGMRSLATQVSIAQQQGILSQEEITRITGKVGEEGVRDYATNMFNAQTQFMQTNGTGRFLTAGLAERDEEGNFTGNLDQDKLDAFRSGRITANELLKIGRESMTSDNAVSFENAMGRGMGANAGSQIGAGGLVSAVGAVLDSMGVKGEQARRRVTAQLTGMRQDMVDSMLKVARESEHLHSQEIIQMQEAIMARTRASNYRENMTLSGQLSKVGTYLRSTLASPFQRAGTSVSDSFAKAGDDAALRIGRKTGAAKIMTAARELLYLPLGGSARVLGINDTTESDYVQNTRITQDYTQRLAFDANYSLFGRGRRGSAQKARSKDGKILSDLEVNSIIAEGKTGGAFTAGGRSLSLPELVQMSPSGQKAYNRQGRLLSSSEVSSMVKEGKSNDIVNAEGKPLSPLDLSKIQIREQQVIKGKDGQPLNTAEIQRIVDEGRVGEAFSTDGRPLTISELSAVIRQKTGEVNRVPIKRVFNSDGELMSNSEIEEMVNRGSNSYARGGVDKQTLDALSPLDAGEIIDKGMAYTADGEKISYEDLAARTLDMNRNLSTEVDRKGNLLRGENRSVSVGEMATTLALSGAGTALRSSGVFAGSGKLSLKIGSSMIKGVGTAAKRRGVGAGARLLTKGLGKVARGAAMRSAGMAARFFLGPIGWALLAVEAGLAINDYMEEKAEEDKIRAWAGATGEMSGDAAVEAFENGDFEKIRKANMSLVQKVSDGSFVPRSAKGEQGNQFADNISKQAYEYLTTSGKLREVIDKGGTASDMIGNIREAIEDSEGYLSGPDYDSMTDEQLNQVVGMIASGKDAQGKEDASLEVLATDFKSSLKRATEAGNQYTIRGTADLAKRKKEITEIFDYQWEEFLDDDEFESKTFEEGFSTGSLQEQEALLAIVENKKLRTAVMNITNNKLLREKYPELASLSDDQLDSIRQDFTNAVNEDGIEKLDITMGNISGKLRSLVEYTNREEVALQMEGVVKAGEIIGKEFGDTIQGKRLAEAFTDGDEGTLADAGNRALDLLDEVGDERLDKMQDGKAKQYLQSVRRVRDDLKKASEGGEKGLRERVLADFKDNPQMAAKVEEFLNKNLDGDGKVSDEELRAITASFATAKTSMLMSTKGMNESELAAAGGQEQVTKEFIEAAKEAAQANTAFVRAVYTESPTGGKIRTAAKQNGGK